VLNEKTVCLSKIPLDEAKKLGCFPVALAKKAACLANVGLSPAKQTACKATALAQKVACASQIITEEALCTSDCACFLISGPNGE